VRGDTLIEPNGGPFGHRKYTSLAMIGAVKQVAEVHLCGAVGVSESFSKLKDIR
jgi:hypothetical protein